MVTCLVCNTLTHIFTPRLSQRSSLIGSSFFFLVRSVISGGVVIIFPTRSSGLLVQHCMGMRAEV